MSTTTNGWTVKGVKSWNARDGIGTECSLYRDGKKVARCLDEGNGGEMCFWWEDSKSPRVEITVLRIRGDDAEAPFTYKGTPEEKLLAEYANARTYEAYGYTNRCSPDTIVATLCDEFENRKKLKKVTYFRIKSETQPSPDSWRVVKAPFTADVKRWLVKKYGDDLGEILNETLGVVA